MVLSACRLRPAWSRPVVVVVADVSSRACACAVRLLSSARAMAGPVAASPSGELLLYGFMLSVGLHYIVYWVFLVYIAHVGSVRPGGTTDASESEAMMDIACRIAPLASETSTSRTGGGDRVRRDRREGHGPIVERSPLQLARYLRAMAKPRFDENTRWT